MRNPPFRRNANQLVDLIRIEAGDAGSGGSWSRYREKSARSSA
jgi:hypothetical protein